MKTEDMKKSELITDVYRAKRVYEAEMKTSEYRAENEEDFEFIGKALFARGYRKAPDVAREIFEEIEKQLARYSHLHRYAEEAREVTEEYADGTPCEMVSVWEVLSLHKNGWDDYETMNKLQDNIEDIAKSRLLKEFEGDIAELKKKYTEGEG